MMPADRVSGSRLSVARWLAAATVLLVVVAWSASAQAWWDEKWPYRLKINLDTGPSGAAITQPIGRVPVLIRLHYGIVDFNDLKEDGSDIRFVAGDDKTPLTFHLEKFDGLVEQVGLAWVDVPELPPGATTSIFMYYGNADAGSAADPKATYDGAQVLVYHFADAGGPPQDQTQFANNATTAAGERDDAGLIGPGLRLDGQAPVMLPASASLAIAAGQPLTWSLWFKPAPGVTGGVLYAVHAGGNGLTIGLDQGAPYVEVTTPSGVIRTPAGTPLKADAWHHVAVVATADKIVLKVDGAPYTEVAGSLPAIAAAAALGAAPAGDATLPQRPGFVGEIDQLQIAKVARPDGYIEAEVRSQGVNANLVTIEGAEQTSGFSAGYAGILFRSVTADGWVVIGLCALIAPITWWVMASKAGYLSRMGRANELFEKAFREQLRRGGGHGAAALTVLSTDENPKWRHSSLFRLYVAGAREIEQRLGDGGRLEALHLAPESLTAIRSALESEVVREVEQLNSRMVLLTIAISGGPFLGLLGTVIGVMITFAAVAAAGDVNVNAIAPGIAAALMATVSGLAVAIPALFGYNYLLTRIKGSTSELQVFLNELISRMAETFRASAGAFSMPQRMAGE